MSKVPVLLTEEKLDVPGSETYDAEAVRRYKLTTDLTYRHTYIATNILVFVVLHAAALYGLWLVLTFRLKLLTFVWGFSLGVASCEGIVLGAHRGYSHNSFKLTAPGQVMVIVFQTLSGQNNIYWWVRDHRLHHKFVDTDADPYNAARGFFFSHMGWLVTRKHPLVLEKGKTIDMTDMRANPLVMFQKKYFVPIFLGLNVMMPSLVPVYCWNEDFWIAFFTCFAYRYTHVLHSTWAINSFAHMYGAKPFDARISACQSNICNILTLGDGWHNYHHVFPWDHSISEFGYEGGLSTKLLYFLQRIGVAYDLKKPSQNMIYKHAMRHGDGSIIEQDFQHK